MADSPKSIIEPLATGEVSANARNVEARPRDRNAPAGVVGLGAPAGGVTVLQQFFEGMAADSGLAFVVVMPVAPEIENNLPSIIQQKTSMAVIRVNEAVELRPNHVYLVPPNKQLSFENSTLHLREPHARRKTANDEPQEELSMQLASQLHKFNTVMTSVPDFIYHFDLEGRFTYVNQSLLDLWQKTHEQALGKNFHELDYPPELAAKLQRQIQKVIETHRPLKDETPYTSASGSRQYEYIFFPLLADDGSVEAVAGVTRDITDRRQAEEALRGSEERFRLLVEGARDYAMFLLNPDNIITFWSSGAERVFGWTQEEAVGQSGQMIFTPEDCASGAVEMEIEAALTTGRAADRRFHLRKDGSRFWADGVLMRLDDQQETLRGFAKVARDATDQRRIEDELRHARDEQEQRVIERTRDLMATNTELERTMAQRQQLERELLEVSEREKRRIGEDLHDMVCQELSATALFLKSSARKVAQENPAAAKTLEESAETVNRNVGVARELARGLQAVELSASGLKNALRALAAQACDNSGIKCHFKAARGVRVPDDTVALHLYRIAQEAVANAVKHSGARNVLITLDRSATHTCVSVQDDGKGFVVRRRRKGLGLHMMRYRANALGGELKIERRRRGGMDITCVIPTKR